MSATPRSAAALVDLAHWRFDRQRGRVQADAKAWALIDEPPRADGITLAEACAQVHPDDRAGLVATLRRALRTGHGDILVRHPGPQGGARRLLLRYAAERDASGRMQALTGIVLDLTDAFDAAQHSSELSQRLAMAAAALKEANERAGLAVHAAGMGTWEQDLQSLTVYWDEQMFRLRGLEPSGPSAPIGRGRELVHPDDRDTVLEAWQESMRTGEPVSYEFRVRWPDGQWHWLASRLVPVKDGHGAVVRQIGVNWDITAAKSAETVRQQQTLALRESQAKSLFLARMSHELRTPLNAVLGFTELLQMESDGVALQPGQRRKLEHVRSAGEYLLSLITDVLDLSSLEAGGVRLELAPVPVGEAVREALPLVETLAQQYHVTVIPQALAGTVLADRTRLRQVLVNLLSNAIKYNRPGGEVRVASQGDGDGVVLRVVDNGLGMTDEQLAHLFEPFNRLGVERAGIEGTGIGLAIVKALVAHMGGGIAAASRAGGGSEFVLRLPIARPGDPARVAEVPSQTTFAELAALGRRLPSAHILCIEDNPLNVMLIEALVAQRPALKLTCEPNGTLGVMRAQQLGPDLVLVDMQLPDFDGFEVLRRLRASPATSGIPCIALSANAMPADVAAGLQAGFAAYWTKPLNVGAFLTSLDSMFS
jgi:PAS domain S-box-containing protein